MEVYEDDHFLEELLAVRKETEENHLLSNNGWSTSFDCFDQNSVAFVPHYSCFSDQQIPQTYNNYAFNEIYSSLLDEFSPLPQNNIADSSNSSSYNNSILDTPLFVGQEEYDYYPALSLMEELEDPGNLLGEELQSLDLQNPACKIEPTQSPEMPANFNIGDHISLERKNRSKKLQGQPSKNLMAERRRRKRLNDRLSMLRSIVPKISKMDRTSILGDTIDYMKELLEKINKLQQEIEVDSHMAGIFNNNAKQNEILLRNSPKFDVERRNVDTQVEIWCAGKPGMLQSTVNTLEELGLEIQQCVISCFNDFTMQASCSQENEQRTIVSSEDIKQALFRSAGYGGRCL